MTNEETAPRGRWPLFAILTIAGTAVLILSSPLLSVRHIEIDGVGRSSTAERVASTGVGEGALLLWVDTGAIDQAVRADPWVSDVRVRRVWPDTVVIEVLERRPVAWIEGVLGWMEVAEDGTVVATADQPGQNLLTAAVAFPDRDPGDRPADPAWHEIVQMALVLEEDLGPTIVLEMRGSEMWTRAAGHEVRLGFPIDLSDKARSLLAIIAGDIPAGAVIDLTSPRRPAVVVEDSAS
jgi:cell division protein FtsQ